MSERVGDGSRYKILRVCANPRGLIQMALFYLSQDLPHHSLISIFSFDNDEKKALDNDGENNNGNGEQWPHNGTAFMKYFDHGNGY
jgi:hypothetical protein